jgi:drug/metabolite transporter (DMT)-like permease
VTGGKTAPIDSRRGPRAFASAAPAGVNTPPSAAVAPTEPVSVDQGARAGVRRPGASSRAIWVALGIVYVAWGSTYLGIRVVDRTVPPFVGAGLRFVLAGALLLAGCTAWRRRFPRVRARELASLALISVLLLAVGNGGVSFAERHIPSGLAALLVASMPLWILVIRTLAGDRPRLATMGGLAVGFVGVALLVLRGGEQQGASLGYMLLVVAAALSWALGSWLSSRLPLPEDVAAGTAIEMLIGGAVLLAIAPVTGEHYAALGHASADSLIAIGYLTVFGSILAFTAYVWVLPRAPISQISTYAYVNPVVAVALGAIILGERITALTLLSGAIIVAAVALVIRSEAPRRRAP